VIVTPEGRLKIEAMGFSGPDCEKATAFLEQALGEPGTRHKKIEYYGQARSHASQKVGS
jgi:hypothetical protein